MVLSEKSENDKYAKQLRSSPGVTVFVGSAPTQQTGSKWVALTATTLGVRTAFVNQPIEVPAVRTQFSQWLGLGSRRPTSSFASAAARGCRTRYGVRWPT